jgi:hypothetical protein
MDYTVNPRPQLQTHLAPGCIFVVSHMRSFSTLLCHILGSHNEISGYVETHQSYMGRIDIKQLTHRIRETTGEPVASRYVLDKMLHNYVYIAPSVLGRSNVKVLFLVRNAEDTLKSILNLFLGQHTKGPITNAEEALDYYATRLRKIEEYSAQLGRHARFLESEKLIDDTDAALAGLSRWLELSEPLSANYRTFKFTGVDHFGDPSPSIRTGSIVASADVRHQTYVPVSVPESVLQRGQAVYATCRETLLRNQGAL